MDLNQAMQAHGEWTRKFRTAMAEQQQLDAHTLAQDNQCALGQLLHGEAAGKYAKLKAYHDCMQAHAHFHSEAGEMAQLINRHDYDKAQQMLMPGTSYRSAADAVALSIFKFREEAGL